MRKFARKLHLWLSIPVGLIISIVCLSGAALIFEKEITQMLYPHLYTVKSAGNMPTLQPSELIRQVRQQDKSIGNAVSLTLYSHPEQTWMLGIEGAGKKKLSVNPHTGSINGWTQTPEFFATMKKLHRWLLNPPASKGAQSPGKFIVGISTLCMSLILLSGLVIWIPRSVRALRKRLTVSGKKGRRRFFYDSHVTLGFYSAALLLLMSLTGLTWSFGWFRSFTYQLCGVEMPKTHQSLVQSQGNTMKARQKKQNQPDLTVWDEVLNNIQKQYPTYSSIQLETEKATVSYQKSGNGLRKETLHFNPSDGTITQIIPESEGLNPQKMKGWIYTLHTGLWGGITTQILYFIAAVIGGLLPLTGYYLWWKRTGCKRTA